MLSLSGDESGDESDSPGDNGGRNRSYPDQGGGWFDEKLFRASTRSTQKVEQGNRDGGHHEHTGHMPRPRHHGGRPPVGPEGRLHPANPVETLLAVLNCHPLTDIVNRVQQIVEDTYAGDGRVVRKFFGLLALTTEIPPANMLVRSILLSLDRRGVLNLSHRQTRDLAAAIGTAAIPLLDETHKAWLGLPDIFQDFFAQQNDHFGYERLLEMYGAYEIEVTHESRQQLRLLFGLPVQRHRGDEDV